MSHNSNIRTWAGSAEFLAAAASALLLAAAGATFAGPAYQEWSTPVPTVGGGCPIESRDGNYLYTAAMGQNSLDIWTYQRNGRNASFSAESRQLAGSPVSEPGANDFCPTPLSGNWLMFVSNRAIDGACGSSDIYLARYQVDPPRSFGDAIHLACAPAGPNTPGTEFSPSVVTTAEGTLLYFSSDAGGNQDIYRSEMGPDGSYGPGEPVTELNTAFADQQPNVSRDGLTIVFASTRDGTGSVDIFMATRESVGDDWSTPINLSVALQFPTMSIDETRPSLSWDLKRLYFGAGGTVYVSERSPGGPGH